MKPKEKELLSLLYRCRCKYLTSREIAARLNLSERTVRSYLNRLKPLIEKNGAKLVATQSKGYQLILENRGQFEGLISQTRLEVLQSSADCLDSASGRRDVILSRLLLSNEKADTEELADSLYISSSTLKKELGELRAMLEAYGLDLQSSKRLLSIAGPEEARRRLILDYFFRNEKFSSLREYIDHSGFFDDVPLENILMILIDEFRRRSIPVSDIALQNIQLHLALAVKRIHAQQTLPSNSLEGLNISNDLMDAAASLMNKVSSLCGITFPPEEVRYLAFHLGMKSAGSSAETDDRLANLPEQIDQALRKMDRQDQTSLHDDPLLVSSLLSHLEPMLLRLEKGVQQPNPLTAQIQDDYPEVLDMVCRCFETIPALRPYKVSMDEWSYFALHILAARERSLEQKKLQVLVICATGLGSSELLKSRILKFFGNVIHIVNVSGYYSMHEEILQGVDLILSSVNIGPVIFGVPFLHVSVFLSEEDIQAIRHFIDSSGRFKKGAMNLPDSFYRQENEQAEQAEKDFARLFHLSRFFVFEKNSRADLNMVMNTLTASIAQYENPGFAEHLKQQMTLRQNMGQVAFSDTIAVPHPAVPLAKTPRFAVALIENGIAWDESHPNIKMVFLMSPSYVENAGLQPAVGAISELIERADLQQQILESGDFETFASIMIQFMKRENSYAKNE